MMSMSCSFGAASSEEMDEKKGDLEQSWSMEQEEAMGNGGSWVDALCVCHNEL
jgi:hypothetical protein